MASACHGILPLHRLMPARRVLNGAWPWPGSTPAWPFPTTHNVERIFTLIEGHGLDLVFDDRKVLKIDQPFVPHEFPGDVKTECVVNNGPCRALNLFMRRGSWKASVSVLSPASNLDIMSAQTTLAFVLRGCFALAEGGTLNSGDALQLSSGESAQLDPQSEDALLYVAALTPVR